MVNYVCALSAVVIFHRWSNIADRSQLQRINGSEVSSGCNDENYFQSEKNARHSRVFVSINDMQVLVVFLTVPILAVMGALSPQDVLQFAVARQKCGNDFTVDPASIDKVRAGEMINDPEFDCYMACILEGMNLMRDGKLNARSAIQKVPDSDFQMNLIEAIRACANQQGRNNCETAHLLYVCMREKGVPSMLSGH